VILSIRYIYKLEKFFVKKLIFILFVLFIHSFAQAQLAAIYADDFPKQAKGRIAITGDYDLNSNTITNSLLTKFYTGGYIDANLKNSVLAEIKNKNRIGGNYSYGFYAAFQPDSFNHKRNISFFVSVRDRFHADARFSNDAYKLAFYGNAQYAGKTAYLDGLNTNIIHYQQFQIGFSTANIDSVARWGIGISFLKGQDYISVLAKKAQLFTSADGQYIDFATDISAVKSDTSKSGLASASGYGASVDMYFEAPFQTVLGSSKVRIAISDLGLIRFNKQTMSLSQDSTFHYSGVQISSFFALQDSTYGSVSRDSLINSIAPFKKKSYSATLPAVLDLAFETQISTRFHITEGIRHVFNANYSVLAYVKGAYYFTPKFMLSGTIGYGGYGGYGRLNYGLGLFANLKNNVVIYAGSNNLEGYIVPKYNAGQGVYVSLIKNFK
jgi:hypothetical protein